MTCIYCAATNQAAFSGVEHVIPQSFGTFGSNTPTLACVCDDCNRFFGRELDQLLARDTLEGVTRYARGQLSSERRPQRRLEITLADGPEAGDFAGLRVAIDGTTGTLMEIVPQFHAFNFQTGRNEVYFLHQIVALELPEAIYGVPAADGGNGTRRVKVFGSDKAEHDALVDQLNAQGIPFRSGERLRPPEPRAEDAAPTLPVVIEGMVDTFHKRALAKILMNFVAWTLGREEALQSRWDFLRNYARYAQGAIRSRLSEQAFWADQEAIVEGSAEDSIDIRIENRGTNVVGAVRFYGRPSYELILSENAPLSPQQESGFRFLRGIEPIRIEPRSAPDPGASQ